LPAVATAVTLAVGLALGAGLGRADANPSTVGEVQAQLEQYQAEQAALDQQYTELQGRLTAAQAEVDRIQAEKAEREATMATLRAQVAQIALRQYQSGNMSVVLAAFTGDDLTQTLSDLTMSQWVSDTESDLLQQYQLEQLLIDELEAAEEAALAQITADQATAAQLLDEANAKVQDTQTLLDRLTAQEMSNLNAAKVSALDAATLAGSAALILPVSAPVTSPFGYRSNPISGAGELHDGTDLGIACGTPVAAAAAGVVTEVRYYGGYGNRVTIDHGVIDGHHYATSYNHLSGFATTQGATVQQGETIAYVGSTGYSTGCHLHFIVWIDGELVDGMQLFG
jgi:murein DD-endopeptidase MepM/ murein hydrolase activator NlpD